MTTEHDLTERAASGRGTTSPTMVHVFVDNVRVREGSRLTSPVNKPNINSGDYRAYRQVAGDPADLDKYHNYYWVDIDTHDGREVWVSAVVLQGGKNYYPQPHVPVHPYGEGEFPPISE